MKYPDIQKAAEEAREKRKEKQDVLIGFCYENAKEMSRQLEKRGIKHSIHKVGIIEDVHQFTHASFDDCVRAAETGEYADDVPQTTDELPAEAQHFITVVEKGRDKIVVEPCSEVRDDNFRDIYIGPWPTKDYLPLEDGRQE